MPLFGNSFSRCVPSAELTGRPICSFPFISFGLFSGADPVDSFILFRSSNSLYSISWIDCAWPPIPSHPSDEFHSIQFTTFVESA